MMYHSGNVLLEVTGKRKERELLTLSFIDYHQHRRGGFTSSSRENSQTQKKKGEN
jgi:hypothetical protein